MGSDKAGALLGAALAGWILVAAVAAGGSPWSAAALSLAVPLSAIGAAHLSRRKPRIVPVFVAASPVISVLLNGTSFLGDGPLGYANASAALYLVAACAGAAAGLHARRTATRAAAFLAAATWAAVPWLLEANVAAAFAALLLPTLWLARNARLVRGLLLCAALLPALSTAAAAVLGAGEYRPSERTNAFDRWFEAKLGELRVELWSDAVDMTLASPLVGVGAGRFDDVSPTTREEGGLARRAHNEYLQSAAESGLLAGALLLLLPLWAAARLWPRAGDQGVAPATVALAGSTLNASIDFIWHNPAVPIALALLVGAASAARTGPPAPEADTAKPPGRRVAPLSSEGRDRVVAATVALWILLLIPASPLNPAPSAPNGATLGPDGLRLTNGGLAISDGAPRRLYDALSEAGELSIELWLTSAAADQLGPARIVSASDGPGARNFTVGQQGDTLVFRLRTTATDRNAASHELRVPGVFDTPELQHIVIATDLELTEVFVSGRSRGVARGPGGTLGSWDRSHPLVIGNEPTGDRSWRGEVRALAFHARALTREDVRRLHNGGVPLAPAEHTSGEGPVAVYHFAGRPTEVVRDRSASGSGPALRIPESVPSPQRDVTSTLLDVGDRAAPRALSHALAFLLWTLAVLGAAASDRAARVPLRVGSAAALVALSVTALRYLAGRAPTVLDLLAAAVGCAAALLVTRVLARRSRVGPRSVV